MTTALGLSWGIKATFFAYVGRLADGAVSLHDGAVMADSECVFPPDPRIGMPEGFDGDGFLPFRGEIRFAGHHGMLVVPISSPWLIVRGNRGELSIVGSGARLRLVTFDIAPVPAPDGLAAWRGTDVQLQPEGVAVFNEVYAAGEPFEELLITLPLAGP